MSAQPGSNPEERLVAVVEIARCYQVEVELVERWCELGLLPPLRRRAGQALLPAAALERVAVILRLTRVVGYEPMTLLDLVESGTLPCSHPLHDPI